jgi:hypothetical protein
MADENSGALLNSEIAGSALREAGIVVSPAQLRVEPRDDRCLVTLPDGRLAWFPSNGRGRERLVRERRVLSLIVARCSFPVPRLLFVSEQGWDLRAPVPGLCDPWGLYRRIVADISLARHIGRAIGSALAEQHVRISEDEAAAWLPARPAWPEPVDWIRQRLSRVIDDRGLLAAIDNVLDAYDRTEIAAADRVLVHGDLGLHNVATDPQTSELCGVFDYDDAAWADRHHDFRYLLFDERPDLLDAALDVYEPAVGCPLSRSRIRLYNAVCAASYLAFRLGTPPDQPSCGRTLAEDLTWIRGALARL